MGAVGIESTQAGGQLVWKNSARLADGREIQDRTFLPPPDQCPLDPSEPGRPTEIPADSYDVVVLENRFPSLRGASALPGTEAGDQAGPALDDGLSPQHQGYGRCEVVCFTSVHNAAFARLTPRRVRTVVEAWRRSPTPSRGRSSACIFRFSPSAARPASTSTWPGPSSGMGVWINDIVPETAARRLREAG